MSQKLLDRHPRAEYKQVWEPHYSGMKKSGLLAHILGAFILGRKTGRGSKAPESEDKTYDVYLEERTKLIQSLSEETQKFDKAILTLAGGAFGFSLAFIQNIVPHPESGTFPWLLASWAGFGLSLLSTMISFLVSQGACRRQIEILEQEFFDNEEQDRPKNVAASWTLGLNIASIAAFILGVIMLVVFVGINVSRKGAP